MLKQRVLTALVLGVAALVTVFALPTWAMAGVLGAVLLIGAWEWSGFAQWGTRGRGLYAAVVGIAMVMTAPLSQNPAAMLWVVTIAALWWIAALIWLFRFPTAIPAWVVALGGLCVILPAWLALAFLHGLQPSGRFMVFLVMASVWGADMGAFFAGRQFGRVKLAPRVSPGKTWEGLAGGLLTAVLVATGLCVFVGADWKALLPIVVCTAIVSVVGDLTVSMFKRNAGLKDSGRVFPGHGGVMDRLDSLAAAAPVFVLGLALSQFSQ